MVHYRVFNGGKSFIGFLLMRISYIFLVFFLYYSWFILFVMHKRVFGNKVVFSMKSSKVLFIKIWLA